MLKSSYEVQVAYEIKQEIIFENVVSSWMITNQSKDKLVKLPETTWLSLEHLAKDIQIVLM